jgi:hypothetical protein
MRKRWHKVGSTFSEELIWLAVQALLALVLVAGLIAYENSAINGGQMAQRVYAADLGMLLTIVSHSPDNIYAAEPMGGFDTTFDVTFQPNQVLVGAANAKAGSAAMYFVPVGITPLPAQAKPVTGVIKAVEEGSTVTLRQTSDWDYGMLSCPSLQTTNKEGFSLRNAVFLAQPGAQQIASVLQARLGASSLLAKETDALAQANGVVIGLATATSPDGRARIVAYYDADAAPDVVERSRKLGCLIINSIITNKDVHIDGAIVPAHLPFGIAVAAPSVMLAIEVPDAMLTSSSSVLANAFYSGVEGYYA